jgi:hypothetical protein
MLIDKELGGIIVKTVKNLKPINKPLPPDAIVKGPNKKVSVNKLLDNCAG